MAAKTDMMIALKTVLKTSMASPLRLTCRDEVYMFEDLACGIRTPLTEYARNHSRFFQPYLAGRISIIAPDCSPPSKDNIEKNNIVFTTRNKVVGNLYWIEFLELGHFFYSISKNTIYVDYPSNSQGNIATMNKETLSQLLQTYFIKESIPRIEQLP
jgi:hypothetical protein